jgi:hypothetical protein
MVDGSWNRKSELESLGKENIVLPFYVNPYPFNPAIIEENCH